MQCKLFRLCSMLLVLTMLFNMLPATAFAADLSTTTADNAAEPSSEETRILGEDESRRTATQKHFRMSDGSFMAVSYGIPVHYQDESGAWQEIDNRLSATANGSVYAARNGDAVTAYAADLSTGQILTAAYGDVSVSMGIMDRGTTAGQMDMNASAQLVTYDRESCAVLNQREDARDESLSTDGDSQGWTMEDIIPAGLNASVIYEDVFPGVDLQYTAFSHHIKEQIIVKEPQTSYRYDFSLSLDGLSAELNDDGSVTLENEDGETVYTIPAPFMQDSAGVISTDVTYSLTDTSDGAVLTVVADKDWINSEDRVLPVRIDPSITLTGGSTTQDVYAVTAMEGAPEDNTLGWYILYAGSMLHPNDVYGRYRLFMHFRNLPEIPAGSIVTECSLKMYSNYYVSNGIIHELPIAAYDVTTNYKDTYSNPRDWFNTITWNNQPAYDDSNVLDYAIASATQGDRHWDLTDAAKEWYFADSDPTIVLTAEDENYLSRQQHASVGFHTYTESNPPVLTVTYRSDVGLEDYYSYTPMSAGRAGTGYINNYTGNLVWVRGDMGFGGNRMPVNINHIYNANNALRYEENSEENDEENDEENINFGLGHGWRTNYNQLIYPWEEDNNYYVWEDEDGTVHYFYDDPELAEDPDGLFRDEDDLDLTLTVSNGYTITDKYGNKSYFDTAGRLHRKENNQETKSNITIFYCSETGKENFIDKITDGVGRVYDFSYNGELLSEIIYKGSGSEVLYRVRYEYFGSELTKVIDNDDKSSSYGYGDNHLLTTVTDLDGYKLQFAYQTTSTGKNSRVESVKEYDGTVAGGELEIEYAHNQTTMKDVSENVQIMQFNNWGNLVSVQDNEGRAQFAVYAKDEKKDETESQTENQEQEKEPRNNQLLLSSKLQNTVGNVLNDSSFEGGTPWTSNNTAVSCAVTTEKAYLGSKSLKMVRSANGNEAGVYGTNFQVSAGETYTFSAYVKTGTGSAYLVWWDGSTVTYSEKLLADRDWTRLEVTYTATSAKTLTPHVLTPNSGTTYIDCVQVEKAPTASRYNLIQNGDFRYSGNWSSSAGRTTLTVDAAASELESTVYKMIGNPLQTNRISQTINVSGKDGDCFALTGWAKGDSVPLFGEAHSVVGTGNQREFAVIGTFNYADGTKESFIARFNPDADSTINWQYSATAMVATADYSSITVELAYDYNVNTVYFDGIQLFKERFGTDYVYYEEDAQEGELKEVIDTQGGKTTYTYNQTHDVISIKLPDNSITTYTYDGYHNVKTATTKEGVVYTREYDTYGNNTKVTIGNGISAEASYTNSGNTLFTTTDTLGNITTYGYDANTNMLDWVRYPKDTNTTQTNYTYDDMNRPETTSLTTDTNTALTANYTYTDDLLTKLQTGSTTYSFNYGNFDLRSNIKIGSRTLASYTYTNRTNYLSSLDYGNGDGVDYTYDQQGRVTKETYEDGDTVTYKYDNDGALATVTDSATGRTTTYYYDFTDRRMKYVESGTDYSHSVGYEYDTVNNLSKLVETINGDARTTGYEYDEDNRVTKTTNSGNDPVSTADDIVEEYTYDSYGRVHTKTTTYGGTEVLTEIYAYVGDDEEDNVPPSTQVKRVRTEFGDSTVIYEYAYDSNGNITSVKEITGGTTKETTYVYDSANQLTRENNQSAEKTWVWTYDDAGNITSRKEYAYTTGSLGTVVDTVSYTYGDSSWGDLLTAYDGSTISHDTMGNPVNDGTWNYIWEHGRQLEHMSSERFVDQTAAANASNNTRAKNGLFTDSDGELRYYVDGVAIYAGLIYENGYFYYINSGCKAVRNCSYYVTKNNGLLPSRTYTFDSEGRITDAPALTGTYDHRTDIAYSYNADGIRTGRTVTGKLHNCDQKHGICLDDDGEYRFYVDDEAIYAGLVYWQGHYYYINSQKVAVKNRDYYPTYNNGLMPSATYHFDEQGRMTNPPSDALTTELYPRTAVSATVTEYAYVYNGTSLSQMTVSTSTDGGAATNQTLDFAYDASGRPMSVTYNGTAYYYALNLQGDVVAILNTSGSTVVAYTYDAWGNLLTTTGSMADNLGIHNPLRYRGYVYDTETGLYYLQSRYYDPNQGRFINADVLYSTGQGLLGNNMFAYCRNNPVCRKDISGTTDVECHDDASNPLDDKKELTGGKMGGSGPDGSDNSQNPGRSSPSGYSGPGNAPPHKVESYNYKGNTGKTEVHHVVERCQANKSDFSKSDIQNPENLIELGDSLHRTISGYYSSKPQELNGLRVRDWLAGLSFEVQTAFGWRVVNYFYYQQYK